jgi:hypothetical protein
MDISIHVMWQHHSSNELYLQVILFTCHSCGGIFQLSGIDNKKYLLNLLFFHKAISSYYCSNSKIVVLERFIEEEYGDMMLSVENEKCASLLECHDKIGHDFSIIFMG